MDTPGHADFGGEAERIMVDGVVLVVDACEEPCSDAFRIEKPWNVDLVRSL